MTTLAAKLGGNMGVGQTIPNRFTLFRAGHLLNEHRYSLNLIAIQCQVVPVKTKGAIVCFS